MASDNEIQERINESKVRIRKFIRLSPQLTGALRDYLFSARAQHRKSLEAPGGTPEEYDQIRGAIWELNELIEITRSVDDE